MDLYLNDDGNSDEAKDDRQDGADEAVARKPEIESRLRVVVGSWKEDSGTSVKTGNEGSGGSGSNLVLCDLSLLQQLHFMRVWFYRVHARLAEESARV